MKRYPAIEFLARHGRRLAWLVFAVIAVVGIACGWLVGNLAAIPVAVVLAALCGLVVRVGVEVVEVIADTLLPR